MVERHIKQPRLGVHSCVSKNNSLCFGTSSAVQGEPARGAASAKGREGWLKSHVKVVPRLTPPENSAAAGEERGQALQFRTTTSKGVESDTPRGLTHPTSDEPLRPAEHAPCFFPTAPET